MSKFNKSYRIRTDIGKDTSVHVKLDRDYDILEIMSLKIDQINDYKLHTSDYGVIAGRVLANDAFGIPNAKISVFISTDTNYNDVIKNVLYPYNTTSSKNKNNIRYNLLPDEQITNCHTIIGTFPEKQYVLDNEDILEVFDKYYKYTTRTNNAGDYMIFGVPVGNQTVHVDIDLSDIGILSQKPYDMVYKGYNIEQFENPNKFKHSTNLENLTQVISQDNVTDVIPFWGDQDEGTIGITRCDIKIQYKFEPTCVFMGSVVSDTASNGISKKCIPSPGMGAMDEITTGSGTIEMIRKTPSGDVEEFQIKGTQLINGDGVWCYQIPMNLDYMMTDEFGNMVPTNDPDKGIPTRTRVRFRISMQDFDSDSINMFRCKMLVPHNPNIYSDDCNKELDYNYGTATKESSYRDLFWNCVYSVKSYIPRIQKGSNWKNEKFTGFKRVNYYNDKNPIPYNNIRIRLPFMYRVLCVIIKSFIKVTSLVNWVLNLIAGIIVKQEVKSDSNDDEANNNDGKQTYRPTFITLSGNLCGDHLENVCYIPGVDLETYLHENSGNGRWALGRKTLLGYALLKFFVDVSGDNIDITLGDIEAEGGHLVITNNDGNYKDGESIDNKHKNNSGFSYNKTINVDGTISENGITLHGIRFTNNLDYLIQCIEMNLAQEYKVIQFDFYNDWINGLIYIPRWMRNIRKKRTFLGITITEEKIKACNENFSNNNRNIVQQCGVKFNLNNNDNFNSITTDVGCSDNSGNNCHKDKSVRLEKNIFKDSGIVYSKKTSREQYVYYFKPCENSENKNIRLFATDIILLGTLNENDKWGIPRGIDELVSSTYQMPPNLALTDSMLEGNEYVLSAKGITMYFLEKSFRVVNIWYGPDKNTTHLSSLDLATETGTYTELSGVNWNYTGPLQGRNKSPNTNDGYYGEKDLYKPGGHFLGLTCRNSQTTIKTCVNLNRICEYGVWMSQRQDINEDYSTTPTGFISGDEIKGDKYRRIFSTLNSNNLKVKRDKDGFLRYDFYHLNPNNFGGELSSHIKKDDDIKGLYNRLMWNGVFEKEYEVEDDDFTDFKSISDPGPWVNNKIVVRTNEFLDKEYYKFRFGLDDNTIKNDDEIKKRFLIYEKSSTEKKGSFPMFNNSFYFYFGLHDGRTALDELKKNYYAVCEKNETLVQDNSDKTFECSNWKIVYDGLCANNPVGEINFDINVSDGLLIDDFLKVTLFDENNDIVKGPIEITESNTKISFDKLKSGKYIVNIKTDDDKINKTYNKEIKKIEIISPDITVVDFIEDVSNLKPEEKYKLDSGYICIKSTFKCEYEDETRYYNIGQEHGFLIESKTRKDTIQNFTQGGNGDKYEALWEGDYINNYINNVDNDYDPTTDLVTNDDGYLMIPVPYENEEYSVKIFISLDDKCKVKNYDHIEEFDKYEINLGNIRVGNGKKFEIKYNGIPYSIIEKYVWEFTNKTSTNDGWWNPEYNTITDWTKEDKLTQWLIKENLYQNTLSVPHKVKIDVSGGTAPYEFIVTGMKENYQTTGLTVSDYENVSIPTINYWKNNKRRHNFSLQIRDKNGYETPDKAFYFPVIYKPFFMEMGIWYFDDQKKYFLYGNVYNGRTWDYKNEGFNVFLINGNSQGNIILTKSDDTFEIDEPALGVENKLNNGSGYGFTGVGKNNGNEIPIDFKYNGRKTIVSKEVSFHDINKENPLQINIGCKHFDNGNTCSDITNISKTDANLYYSFEISKVTYEGKSYIKMITKNNINNEGSYKDYIVFDSDIDGYAYPLVNGELNISDNLFRDLIDDKLHDTIETDTINGESGYINVSRYKNTSNGKIYYISIPDNSDSLITERSNPENKLKCVSISQIIDLNQIN